MSTPQSAAAPVLEPTTQKFIDALAAAVGTPIYTLSPDAARDVLAGAQAQPVAKLPASIEDTTFPVDRTPSSHPHRARMLRNSAEFRPASATGSANCEPGISGCR